MDVQENCVVPFRPQLNSAFQWWRARPTQSSLIHCRKNFEALIAFDGVEFPRSQKEWLFIVDKKNVTDQVFQNLGVVLK